MTLCFSYEILIHLVSGYVLLRKVIIAKFLLLRKVIIICLHYSLILFWVFARLLSTPHSRGALLTFSAVCYTTIVISYSRSPKTVDESSALVDNEVLSEAISEGHKPGWVDNQDWKIAGLMSVFAHILTVLIVLAYWPQSWSFLAIRLPIIILLLILLVLILIYIKVTYFIQTDPGQGFICPFVPFFPAAGLALNMGLFSSLDLTAHLMTLGYVGVGVVVYFCYGYFNSRITLIKRKERAEEG